VISCLDVFAAPTWSACSSTSEVSSFVMDHPPLPQRLRRCLLRAASGTGCWSSLRRWRWCWGGDHRGRCIRMQALARDGTRGAMAWDAMRARALEQRLDTSPTAPSLSASCCFRHRPLVIPAALALVLGWGSSRVMRPDAGAGTGRDTGRDGMGCDAGTGAGAASGHVMWLDIRALALPFMQLSRHLF
jgi:hypothetical protein